MLALPAAVATFNGFHTRHGAFVMENANRVLIALAAAALLVLVGLVAGIVADLRRR